MPKEMRTMKRSDSDQRISYPLRQAEIGTFDINCTPRPEMERGPEQHRGVTV